jgi:hypothetical protein
MKIISPHKMSSRSRSPSRTTNRSMSSVAKLISLLFNSREQTHILHLQTKSFASHKALQGYYEGIIPLADKYAETYQGKYGIIMGYTPLKSFVQGDKSILPYFKKLEKEVQSLRKQLPNDLDLENAYADILDLIHSTQYLLTYLK